MQGEADRVRVSESGGLCVSSGMRTTDGLLDSRLHVFGCVGEGPEETKAAVHSFQKDAHDDQHPAPLLCDATLTENTLTFDLL